MYLTFDEFLAFGGGDSDSTAEFDSACRRAAGYIDYYTQGRIKAAEDITDGVKLAIYEICSLLMTENEDIESYSSDGVSVTLTGRQSLEDKIYASVRRNLPQKLTFLGVNKND